MHPLCAAKLTEIGQGTAFACPAERHGDRRRSITNPHVDAGSMNTKQELIVGRDREGFIEGAKSRPEAPAVKGALMRNGARGRKLPRRLSNVRQLLRDKSPWACHQPHRKRSNAATAW
jgi:hypothetical protein